LTSLSPPQDDGHQFTLISNAPPAPTKKSKFSLGNLFKKIKGAVENVGKDLKKAAVDVKDTLKDVKDVAVAVGKHQNVLTALGKVAADVTQNVKDVMEVKSGIMSAPALLETALSVVDEVGGVEKAKKMFEKSMDNINKIGEKVKSTGEKFGVTAEKLNEVVETASKGLPAGLIPQTNPNPCFPPANNQITEVLGSVVGQQTPEGCGNVIPIETPNTESTDALEQKEPVKGETETKDGGKSPSAKNPLSGIFGKPKGIIETLYSKMPNVFNQLPSTPRPNIPIISSPKRYPQPKKAPKARQYKKKCHMEHGIQKCNYSLI